MTFLFQDIIVGPIHSRRFGNSLGVNLLPVEKKVCNYDCVYCECGQLKDASSFRFCSLDEVVLQLEKKLQQLTHENLPDVITFAGNGEPTLHPEFGAIIDRVITLRNQYVPSAKIVVLSNATTLHNPSVFNALQKIDVPMLKLDGGNQHAVSLINQPVFSLDFEDLVQKLILFRPKLIIQTLFFRGKVGDEYFDNTSAAELSDWLQVIMRIKPQKVTIYTIARDTPIPLEPVTLATLEGIAEKLKSRGVLVETVK